jgi:hypothetical protein
MLSSFRGGPGLVEEFMLESRYLKDNIENIQKLLAIPALKNFETRSLRNLLRLSKIREYESPKKGWKSAP